MATRFYFDRTNTPAVSPPTPTAEWEHVLNAIGEPAPVRRLNSPIGSSALNNQSALFDNADDLTNKDACGWQFVSLPLAAQTIAAQTVSLQIQVSEDGAANNLFLTWKIYLIDSSGAAVSGGTLLAIRRDATEMSTTVTNRGDSATTTEVVASSGDRIVVEIGLGGTPTSSGGTDGHNGTFRVGENGASGDLPIDDTTTTTTYNPWINFANTLQFYLPGPPRPTIIRQAVQRAAVR